MNSTQCSPPSRDDFVRMNRLAIAAKQGDLAALTCLLSTARFLARRIGFEMGSANLPPEDCASIAIERFVLSLKKFDPAKADILRYWYYQGRLAILDYRRSFGPASGRRNAKLVRLYREELEQEINEHGRRFLDIERFAAKHGVSRNRALRAAEAAATIPVPQFAADGLAPEERASNGDPSPDKVLERNEDLEAVRAQLKLLAPRHRRIVAAYFGIGDTPKRNLAEIGRSVGITAERTRQIIVEALSEMRAGIRRKQLGVAESASP